MAEVIGATTGSAELEKSIQKNGLLWKVSRSFTRDYLVLADSCDESTESILSVVSQPLVYYRPSNSYDNKLMVQALIGPIPGAFICKSVKIKEVDTTTHPTTGLLTTVSRITCEFDNDFRLDPLEMEPQVKVTCENVERALEYDVVNGKPVRTVPGEKLPAVTADTVICLEITRFEAFPYPMNNIRQYKNTVCSGSFWGAPAYHALLDDISFDVVDVELTDEIKKKFAQVHYRIKFRFEEGVSEPWKLRTLHYGNLRYEKQGEAPIRNVDDYNKPCPCNLDQNGFKLGENAAPVFLEFNKYRKISWSSLHLNFNDIFPNG